LLLRRFGVWWVLLGVVGVLLGVFGPVERAVSRFEVVGVGSRLDVSLPLSDRSPASLSLGFATLGRVPVGRVPVFSGVARDVAWEVRSAGGLVVALDAGGVWLGAKEEWVRVGGWLPFSRYELVVFGDRSAELTRWSSGGAGSVVGRVASGGVPLFEVTGLHARGAGLVSWGDVRVVSSPSEDHRPSVWMLLGYVLVVVSAAGVVVSERGSLRRRSPTRWVRDVFVWCRGVWWLWVVVVASIVFTPPGHSESWVIGDLRIMNWVRLYDLGEYVTSPLGGLFYFLLGVWSKVVVPVWLLRLPVAVVFVVAVVLFSRRFVVDRFGAALSKGGVVQSVLVVLVSVLGQGEWLRPEIPILSLWMLAVAVLAGVAPESGRNGTRIVAAGLLAGLAVHHPMGLAAAASVGLFAVLQMWSLGSKGVKVSGLIPPVVSAGAVAVIATMFGHNTTSFLHALERFDANSPAHDTTGLPLLPRLEDLQHFPLLFRFILPLSLGSLFVYLVLSLKARTRCNYRNTLRIVVAATLAVGVMIPSGPWGVYFAYLAPLAAITLNSLISTRVSRRLSRITLSGALMIVALVGVAASQSISYRFLMAPVIAGICVGMALIIFRPATVSLTGVFVLGVVLMLLPGRVNEWFATTPALAKASLLNGPIESATGYSFQETMITPGRVLGYGPDCGFISQIVQQSGSLMDGDAARSGHLAYRYGLHSPCTPPPRRPANQEGVARIVHNATMDMLFFGRALVSILEHRYHKADVICLSAQGVVANKEFIGRLAVIDPPNCVILTHPFDLLRPASVVWRAS